MEIRRDAWQERYAACCLARAPYSVLCAVLLPTARGRRTIDAEKEMPRLARMTRGRALVHAGPRADETATPWSRYMAQCHSFEQSLGRVFLGELVHFGAFRYQDLGAGIVIFRQVSRRVLVFRADWIQTIVHRFCTTLFLSSGPGADP
jgi:hypothetical protein